MLQYSPLGVGQEPDLRESDQIISQLLVFSRECRSENDRGIQTQQGIQGCSLARKTISLTMLQQLEKFSSISYPQSIKRVKSQDLSEIKVQSDFTSDISIDMKQSVSRQDKNKIHIARVKSYKSLYEESLDFLKAIVDENIDKAEHISNHAKTNAQIFKFVVAQLKRKPSPSAQKTIKDDKSKQNIRQNNDHVVKNTAKEHGQIVLHIFQQVSDGFFPAAINLAAKNKLRHLETIIQQLWEYRWIQYQLSITPQQKAANSFKKQGFEFSAQRRHISMLVLQDSEKLSRCLLQIEEALDLMINPTQPINFKDMYATNKVKAILEKIYQELALYRTAVSDTIKQEQKTLDLIKTTFPQTKIDYDHSFFTNMRRFVRGMSQHLNQRASSKNSLQYSHEQSELELVRIHSRQAVENRGEQGDVRGEYEPKKIETSSIQMELAIEKDRGRSNQRHILARVEQILNKGIADKCLKQLLQTQQRAVIQQLIEVNQVIQSFSQSPLLYITQATTLKEAIQILGNEFKQVSHKLIRLQPYQDYSLVQRQSDPYFGPSMKPEQECQDELSEQQIHALKELERKDKLELIDIIREHRLMLQITETQKESNREAKQQLQVKVKKLDMALKESMVLQQSLIMEEGSQTLEIQQLAMNNQMLTEQVQRYRLDLAQFRANIPRLIAEAVGEVTQQKESLMKELSLQRQKAQDFQVELQQLKAKQQAKTIQKQEALQAVQTQAKVTKATMEELLQKNRALEKQLEQLTSQNQQLKLTIKQQQTRIGAMNEEEKVRIQCAELHQTITRLKEELERQGTQHQMQGQILHQKQQALESISLENEQLKQKCLDLARQCEEKQHQLLRQPSSNSHLFALGSIFNENFAEEREYLIDTLTGFLGPLKRTNLLYRYDSYNKTNPHKYIDNHGDIVLIVKTIFGRYIAAYSKQPFQARGCKQGFGLLMSLWNKNVYEIISPRKAITFDEFFIIFGNSQLRIRSQQTKVFSNFGINNGFFNSRGNKIESFLGEGSQREVNIETFEVYSLDLQRYY